MISTLIFVFALLTAIGWATKTRKNAFPSTSPHMVGRFNIKWLFIPVAILIAGLLTALIQPYGLERVKMSHVGLKVNLTGDARGVSAYKYKTGWVPYNTWTEELYEIPTFQQHIEYENLQVITKGGFPADIKPSFNYSLVPDAVGDMFVNLRLDVKQLEQGWLKNAIYSSVNDVANKWTVDSIFNDRELFESSIVVECNKRLSKWFNVSQLRTNIVPPSTLKESIERKTKAIQDVQVAESNRKVADAQALEKIAIAKGDSAQAVIFASGKAEAMRREQLQLSPLYIEYVRAQNWNGVLSTTVLGSSSGAFINVK